MESSGRRDGGGRHRWMPGLVLASVAALAAGACDKSSNDPAAAMTGSDGGAQADGGDADGARSGGASRGTVVPGAGSGGTGRSSGGAGGSGGTGGIGGANGVVVPGGSGGGGSGGGGSGGTAGSPATRLGRACRADQDCFDPAGPGLVCIKATDTVLANGAPPGGLCSAPCTVPAAAADVDACSALGPGALCYPFNKDSNQGYCVEGCSFGTPDLGAAKCHDRPEFACNPALLGATNTACKTSDDCPQGDLCVDGECDVVYPGCLPSCRGDLDCEPGLYCDQSFLSGVCVTKKPVGKALGEPCTVLAAGDPREPDECLGFCQADSDGGVLGHCATSCGLARQCAWNAATEKFDGVCFYASRLDQDTADVGDFGFCTPSCNCTDDCKDPTLACSLLSQGALSSDFRGAGLCFAPDKGSKEYNQCTGAGGADAGSGGAGGGDATGAGGVR